METNVSLLEMLDARERRAQRQQQLQAQYRTTLVCFTMNIAGPVKISPLIRRGFARGRELLERQFLRCRLQPLHVELVREKTGCEAFYLVDADPLEVKKLTTLVEDASPLGRLFDMDVLCPDGRKVDREELHLEGRRCLICGGPAKACSSRRIHTVAELQEKTTRILEDTFNELDIHTAAQQAVRALLYEVTTTPKPGLVDRRNSGSHNDMDSFTFMSSAAALGGYFEACARVGRETAAMTAGLTAQDLAGVTAETAVTAGQKLYLQYGITGVRGQVEAGLPAVLDYGLPALEQGLAQGYDINRAGCGALLAILAHSTDTNIIARSSRERQLALADALQKDLADTPYPDEAALTEMDDRFIAENLSPGGSADLLALTYLLHFFRSEVTEDV